MTKRHFLEFEQPIAELEAKIEELRYVQNESAVDISEEIDRLEQEEPAAHQGHLLQPDAVAGDADRAPSAAAVHARLRQRDLHRLPGAARRPRVRRRPVDRRRAGALQRPAVHGDRPPEGARHQGARGAQLRHVAARGLPQGAAPDEAGREVRPAGLHVRRHAGRLSRHRRRGARPVGGDRPQHLRDGAARGADHRHHHRRGRLRRRARDRRRRPAADAAVLDLLGDLARRLRVDPVEDRRARARGRRAARHHGAPAEGARPGRQDRQRAGRRRASRPEADGRVPQARAERRACAR